MKRLFILTLLLLLPLQAIAVETTEIADEIYISASFKDTSLAEVLENLSEQTGYIFEIPEEWSDINASGEFVQTGLHTFFKRVLKEYNFSLIIDDQAKIVTAKDLGGTTATMHTAPRARADEHSRGIAPEPGMLKKDLQDLHNAQLTEMWKQKEDLDGIDPMSNLTNSHLKELHRQQYGESERRIEDGSAVDPMSGMPLSELKRLHEQQLADFNK